MMRIVRSAVAVLLLLTVSQNADAMVMGRAWVNHVGRKLGICSSDGYHAGGSPANRPPGAHPRCRHHGARGFGLPMHSGSATYGASYPLLPTGQVVTEVTAVTS